MQVQVGGCAVPLLWKLCAFARPICCAVSLVLTMAASAAPPPADLEQKLHDLEALATRQPSEAQRTLDQLRAAHPTLDERDSLYVELIRAGIASSQYRSADVLAICAPLAPRLAALNDAGLLRLDAHLRAGALYELGLLADGPAVVAVELAQARRAGDSSGIAMGLLDRVRYSMKTNDLASAIEAIADAQTLVVDAQTAAEIAFADSLLERNLQEWDSMLAASRKALDRFAEVGDQTGIADSLAEQGFALGQLKQPETAITALDEAVRIYRSVGDRDGEGVVLADKAHDLFALSQPAAALALSAAAERLLASGDGPWHLAQARMMHARLLLATGQPRAAVDLLALAHPALVQQNEVRVLIQWDELKAEAEAALGHAQLAYETLRAAREHDKAYSAELVARQLATQRGRLERDRVASENRLLRLEADSNHSALAAAVNATHYQQVALVLGALLLTGAAAAVWRQRILVARIALLAGTDHVTGLRNRRSVLAAGQELLQRTRLDRRPCAVLMIDIDRFKQVNDQHGHLAGDTALRRVSDALAGCLRPGDVIGRFGGEEFLAVLPDTGREQAQAMAECMRCAVQAIPADWAPAAPELTVSGGITVDDGGIADFGLLLARADRALYLAKAAGRNRIEFACPDLPQAVA